MLTSLSSEYLHQKGKWDKAEKTSALSHLGFRRLCLIHMLFLTFETAAISFH